MPVPLMSAAVSSQTKGLRTPKELFGVIPQKPVSTPASSVMNKPMMPLPVRRPGGKKYERDLRDILELLDEPVEDLTNEVVYSKMGTLVACTCQFTWTSATGTLVETDGNCVIGTPYTSLYVPRYVNVLIQKDLFASTKLSFMDVASAAVQTRINAVDMPGYTTGATLLISFHFYTLP